MNAYKYVSQEEEEEEYDERLTNPRTLVRRKALGSAS